MVDHMIANAYGPKGMINMELFPDQFCTEYLESGVGVRIRVDA
jgi:hypothetical protein